jgi:DNA-directed RNA polymerase subunit RPC12/RpoP
VSRRHKGKKGGKRLCKCTRCGASLSMTHAGIRAISHKASGLRCLQCGGNVVEARYAK